MFTASGSIAMPVARWSSTSIIESHAPIWLPTSTITPSLGRSALLYSSCSMTDSATMRSLVPTLHQMVTGRPR
jgi:hypothetical protein